MQTVSFTYSVNIILVAGGGTARLGPQSARERWHDMTVSVSASPLIGQIAPVNEAQCSIYTGDVNTKRFRDGCVDGSTGDSTTNASGTIKCGEFVWATWSGGDSGVAATLTVEGMKDV